MIKGYTEFERCRCESSEKEEVVWTDVVGNALRGRYDLKRGLKVGRYRVTETALHEFLVLLLVLLAYPGIRL